MLVVERPYPLASRTIEPEDMDRSTSSSVSEEESRSPDQSGEEKITTNPTPERRKRHRRGKKRKWKPYSKMTQAERKELELAQAARREAEMARSRRPVAPSNTTQFIMEDRGDAAVRIPSPSRPVRSISYESSPSGVFAWPASPVLVMPSPERVSSPLSFFLGDEGWYDSPEEMTEQDAFLEEDFNQVYAQLRMDRLDHMTKEDLVHQCVDLEQKVFSLQEERDEKQAIMQRELTELRERNTELAEENSRLRTLVPTSAS